MVLKNLKHIEINIGKACNNKCIFCMSYNSNKNMMKLADFDHIKERLVHYRSEGYNSIGYLGGDISIHPRIIDIISLSKELGFKDINIITNGMLFSDYEFAKNIILAGATRVNISVHSHIDEIEDHITQVPGGLKKKLKAIDNFNLLVKKGLLNSNVSINIVVCKINMESILETIIYFYKYKQIKDVRINFIWLKNSNKLRKNWEDLTIKYENFLPYLKKIMFFSIKHKQRITFDTIPACIFYKLSNISGARLVNTFLGEQFDIIDQIEHVNVADIREKFNWKEKKKNTLKSKFRTCKKCLYNYTCEGIWSEYKTIYGSGEFEPILKK